MEVGRKDNYAREVKMAECLTNSAVPPEWIKLDDRNKNN